jgi:crossover junction endonuclease MUS81
MIEKLGRQGILCEARALSVSDFMWIARHKRECTLEVILDAMIERKRVSDLVSSIRDGRYHEQRSRLRKTNLQRIIYVIEGRIADDSVHGLPLKTVESVLASMNVSELRPQVG